VIVPLVVLVALKPHARNPRSARIQELFCTPPEQARDWIRGPYRSGWDRFFKGLDSVLRAVEPAFPSAVRQRTIKWSVDFVTTRLAPGISISARCGARTGGFD
jgi:squalene-hopene/tetraprenyl-beta-curcumene cyclase